MIMALSLVLQAQNQTLQDGKTTYTDPILKVKVTSLLACVT